MKNNLHETDQHILLKNKIKYTTLRAKTNGLYEYARYGYSFYKENSLHDCE